MAHKSPRTTATRGCIALVALLLLALSPSAWAAQTGGQPQGQQGAAQPDQGPEPLRPEFREILSQHGKFASHPKYGEVWTPSETPQGWHPYPPCHWVNTGARGWYFDDKTPWGAIVHHYGRWAHDDNAGWLWVPGNQFSPGWVVWRTGGEWIGWAPMPPDADIQMISADAFNNGGFWIFMEAAKFTAGCGDGAVAPADQTPTLVRQTSYVTQISFVDGIAVVQLPPAIVGTIVDINVTFDPWPAWFFTQVVVEWNWVWSTLTIIVTNECPRR